MIPLDKKTALVTGASRGIGEAAARALDAAGAKVILTGRTVRDLERVASDLEHDPLVIPFDLGLAGAGTRLAKAVLSRTGGVDVLLNNAGMAIKSSPEALKESELDKVFAVKFPITSHAHHRSWSGDDRTEWWLNYQCFVRCQPSGACRAHSLYSDQGSDRCGDTGACGRLGAPRAFESIPSTRESS